MNSETRTSNGRMSDINISCRNLLESLLRGHTTRKVKGGRVGHFALARSVFLEPFGVQEFFLLGMFFFCIFPQAGIFFQIHLPCTIFFATPTCTIQALTPFEDTAKTMPHICINSSVSIYWLSVFKQSWIS